MKCRFCQAIVTECVGEIKDVTRAGLFGSLDTLLTLDRIDLRLLICEACLLCQLDETNISLSDQYSASYGYRSGLNPQMVRHQQALSSIEKKYASLAPGDFVMEIGANDGTHLRSFSGSDLNLIAVDPTLHKFQSYYDFPCEKLYDFYPNTSSEQYRVKLLVSHACLYDIPDLNTFLQAVKRNLHDNGIWSFEQSYLPLMLHNNAFDSICDEHLEYYSLNNIEKLLTSIGMCIQYLSFSMMNGGSVHIIARKTSEKVGNPVRIPSVLFEKDFHSFDVVKKIFGEFWTRVNNNGDVLREQLTLAKANGPVYAVGASTKGSIILQYYQLGDFLDGVLEINEDKFNKHMAGTKAPILDERNVNLEGASVILLPWHFESYLVERYLNKGATVISPLPYCRVFHGSY